MLEYLKIFWTLGERAWHGLISCNVIFTTSGEIIRALPEVALNEGC